jgi:hypothetical protein
MTINTTKNSSAPLSMATRSQLWACYAAIPFMLLFFIGWVFVAQFLPPLNPAMSAQELATLFSEHGVRIRLGMLVCLYSVLFLMPFTALICVQIARIEGNGPKVWTYTGMLAAAGNILSFTFPIMFWNVAAFRADRAPELVMLMNDMAWLPWTGMTVPFVAIPPCVAIAGFMDRNVKPVFPRWFCYFTIATTVIILPAAMVTFFPQGGWFAWNNLFGWWVPFADFFLWFLILFVLLRKGILNQTEDELLTGATK